MTIIFEEANFKVTNIILSQQNLFTLEDVFLKASKENIGVDITYIKHSLLKLTNSGLVRDYGSKYSLSTIMTR